LAADAPVERTTGALSSRDRVGRALLWLAALGAVVSAVSALSSVVAANDSTRGVEVWRMYGLAVFAGLFVLLALRPRQYRGVWELAIANKLALTVTGMALLAGTIRGVRARSWCGMAPSASC